MLCGTLWFSEIGESLQLVGPFEDPNGYTCQFSRYLEVFMWKCVKVCESVWNLGYSWIFYDSFWYLTTRPLEKHPEIIPDQRTKNPDRLRMSHALGSGTHIIYYIYIYVVYVYHTYTHIHIHIYTYTHIHIYTYTFIHSFIHTDIHACIDTFIVRSYMHACMDAYIITFIHACIDTFIVRSYMHTYIHTYIHTYMHT